MKIRIKSVDKMGNVAYVHKSGEHWHCTLANGISASMSYAGLGPDQMAVLFALDDCETAEEALAVCQGMGAPGVVFTLV